jgi:hypothetical protein
MGKLQDHIDFQVFINGKDIAETYKNNTMMFYEAYKTSSKEILNLPLGKIQKGAFYFFHYKDDSKWMQYSPVFVTDFKKFDNLIIIYAVNFNFIPLQIRATIFDRYMVEEDFTKNRLLPVDYEGMYKALLSVGYEYALIEYNLSQVVTTHKIDVSLVPKFIYSGHPINKYDPVKLYSIWKKKLETRSQRHEEMMNVIISDIYEVEKDLSDDYKALEGHINRIRKSYEKYGK